MKNIFLDIRQILRSPVPLTSWVVASLICTLTGPLGTYAADPYSFRLIFWTSVLFIATMYALFCFYTAFNIWPKWSFLKAGFFGGVFFAITYSCFGIFIVDQVYGNLQQPSNALIFAIVSSSTAAIVILIHWVDVRPRLIAEAALEAQRLEYEAAIIEAAMEPVNASNPLLDSRSDNPFLSRLNTDIGTSLIRLHMRDHYVETYTGEGMQLIHMRFADAVDALSSFNGYQTHRSHWVNLDEVKGVKKVDGKTFFVMADEAKVPITRKRHKELKELGAI
ncbi:LytTR family DNA-binding domain-containing protein [Amylibacter sp. SFDW26]|uniref:LytTR family DNA-binding domain-containing protein n=1 Tax=Amylibacter sp. SFDW26 TaxID=2652722 RepID=UPI00186A5171|nr:LytTR family DNA-binding domain-containing protein [Amylibacter sp. SFDW26]